jgi:glycosyltransferase 2 family protein
VPIDTIADQQASGPVYLARAAAVRMLDIAGAKSVGLVLKIGVSAGLIAFFCWHIDFASLIDGLNEQSAAWIAATALVGLLQIALLGFRWQQILCALGGENGLGSALAVTFMGCFFGAFLFGPTGGDVARAVLAPTHSLGRRRVVHSVLFERLASVVGLGLAAAPMIAFSASRLGGGWPLLVAIAMVPLPFAAMAVVRGVAEASRERDNAVFHALRDFDQSRRHLVRVWPRFAFAVAIAAIGQLLVAVEAWCLSQSQHLGVPLVDFAILMPTVMLLVALPISAGGWGVREGAIVAALALVGVGTAPALLLSVELGVIGTLVSLPGGAIWLYRCFCRAYQPKIDIQGMA